MSEWYHTNEGIPIVDWNDTIVRIPMSDWNDTNVHMVSYLCTNGLIPMYEWSHT